MSHLFVCNRGVLIRQLGGLRLRELGQSPILWSLVSLGEFNPNTTISYIAFRYCPELSMTIWSAYIRLEQVHLDPHTPPPGQDGSSHGVPN